MFLVLRSVLEDTDCLLKQFFLSFSIQIIIRYTKVLLCFQTDISCIQETNFKFSSQRGFDGHGGFISMARLGVRTKYKALRVWNYIRIFYRTVFGTKMMMLRNIYYYLCSVKSFYVLSLCVEVNCASTKIINEKEIRRDEWVTFFRTNPHDLSEPRYGNFPCT